MKLKENLKLAKNSYKAKEQKNLESLIKNALKKDQNVQLLSVNGNNSVIINGYKYFDNQKDNTFKGGLRGWVFSDIIKCIYSNIDNWTNEVYRKTTSYKKNNDIKLGDEIVYIDIDHCYLQVANKLGYICEKDYFRLLKKYNDIKIEICASFTSLYKTVRCTYFNKNGDISRKIQCFNYELELIRDNIINYSNSIMADYQGEYYFRNVDAIVIHKNDHNQLESYLLEKKLKFKKLEGIYIGDNTLYNSVLDELVKI